jgi:hypothetical protein
MKKLLTLALALSVAFAGFAQVQKVASKSVKPVAAQEQITDGSETFENVGNVRGMTYSQTDLDYTTCDWQTNTASKNWTMHFPDGCLGFTWIASFEGDYSDRGTGIGIYNPNTDEWTTSNGLVENHKTGFGTAARFKDNGIVVVSRNPITLTCEVYIIEDKDNLPTNSLSPIFIMKDEYNPHFPTVMCTGPNHDHIHILVTALNQEINGQQNPYFYYRSMDGGQTWEEDKTIEYLGRDYSPGYGSGSDAYFMENTGGNELNIVVNTGRGDGVVLTSLDEGNTWNRTEFYHHPGIDVDYGEAIFLYPRWTSALWDNERNLHVAYEWNGRTGDPTSTSYYPGMGGVAYWNSVMPYKGDGVANGFDPNNPLPPVKDHPFIMDSAYIYQDIYASWWLWSDAPHEMWSEYIGYPTPLDENEQPLADPYQAEEFNMYDHGMSNHGHYNGGVCEMPVLMMTPNGDMMVAVWMSLDDHHLNGGASNDLIFFKLFTRASFDNGVTWTPMRQITDDFMFQYTEFVYPQAAIDPINNQLVVVVQADGEPDSFLIGTGGDTDQFDNLFTALTFDLNDLFGYDGIGEGPMMNNTTLSVYPNPVSERLTVTLNQEDEVVIYNMMGQTVSSFQGHTGINTVDVSNMSSGIYFISAGSATQKFIVK